MKSQQRRRRHRHSCVPCHTSDGVMLACTVQWHTMGRRGGERAGAYLAQCQRGCRGGVNEELRSVVSVLFHHGGRIGSRDSKRATHLLAIDYNSKRTHRQTHTPQTTRGKLEELEAWTGLWASGCAVRQRAHVSMHTHTHTHTL